MVPKFTMNQKWQMWREALPRSPKAVQYFVKGGQGNFPWMKDPKDFHFHPPGGGFSKKNMSKIGLGDPAIDDAWVRALEPHRSVIEESIAKLRSDVSGRNPYTHDAVQARFWLNWMEENMGIALGPELSLKNLEGV